MKQNVPMVGASEAPQGSVLLSFNDPRLRHRQPTSLSIFHVLCPPSGTLARGSPFTGTTSTQSASSWRSFSILSLLQREGFIGTQI